MWFLSQSVLNVLKSRRPSNRHGKVIKRSSKGRCGGGLERACKVENHLHSVFHLLLCQTEMGSLDFSALLHSAWQEHMCQLARLTLKTRSIYSVPFRAFMRHHGEFLRYGNSFPPTFPEVLLAHASQLTGQLSQSMQIWRAREAV